MATLRLNFSLQSFSGSIGKRVFKQYYGQINIASTRSFHRKESPLQKENRSKIKDAARWTELLFTIVKRNRIISA